ncbi:hypothetical protein ACRAWG_31300 [Methylobacterium sp. P31]
MEYEVLDDGELAGLPDDFQEANGVAFLLASNAYLTLAEAYLRREEAAALALMNEIETQITGATRRFLRESPHGAARQDVVLEAAHKLGALMNAGRALSKAAPGVH